ncbi:SUMF1/EgtB/PvdO family nonheme iron enzyme [Cryomorphaceae bacterium 1068]|nr:SUMF1/EgtB/PvdO family nonheme iron enzyme [Cryomorphaceae bacterium 1068]
MKVFSGKFLIVALMGGVIVSTSSCSYESSSATGWNYNDPANGGFEKVLYTEQETGPGLILIEGGTFTMGATEEMVMKDWNNIPRRVTVSSFYMDETEVTNVYWLEYLYWLRRVYGADYPEIYRKALPDTLVWRSRLAYNEPYVEYYLRHPAYNDYPVVGVNWLQANDFCAWRSDRVNEAILIREGLFEHFPQQINEDHFDTDAYLAGQYESGKRVDGLSDLDPDQEFRNVRMEDGILLPRYRLPTEAEWEFAAYGLVGNSFQELVTERKVYPWNGHYVREGDNNSRFYGELVANFVRGKGDYMGVAGSLNDNADVTAPVYAYQPNDYGLYNMAGNVSEWVMDVYRPLSPEDMDEFRPFRGNVYKTKVLDSEGSIDDKLTVVTYDVEGVNQYIKDFDEETQGKLNPEEAQLMENLNSFSEQALERMNEGKADEAYTLVRDAIQAIRTSGVRIAPELLSGVGNFVEDTPGNVRMRKVRPEENIDRDNYRLADNIDYKDGDFNSSINYTSPNADEASMYDYGNTTLISNRARVYKGGSWRDRAYYLSPGTRRFMDERKATATIGFRCAMDRVGSPVGFNQSR